MKDSGSAESRILDLPLEILFKVFLFLENEDINNLYTIQSIRRRIEPLFAVASDMFPSDNFPNIPDTYSIEDISLRVPTKHKLLWLLVEVHDLRHTYQMLPAISKLIDNKISVFDDVLPYSWDTHITENSSSWLQNFGSRTKSLTFECLTRLALSDVSIDPKLIRFPRLKTLKLTRVQSTDIKSKLYLPELKSLYVSAFFNSINSCLDYENTTSLKTLTITGIIDLMKWENIRNSSLKIISIYECVSLVVFTGLDFGELESLIIKDTDVHELSHITAPSLTSIHIEQFLTSDISLSHLNLPLLRNFLLWTFEISNIYDIFVPSLKQASIMLSKEPVPTITNKIDLTCFKTLKTIQICCAAEILQYVEELETLEVRGPFDNQLLFDLEFNTLKSFHVYFNNRLTKIPKIKSKNLESLIISRCSRLSNIKTLEQDYPTITSLTIEYSELRDINNFKLEELQTFVYVTSTSQPIFVLNCKFPKLISFEALNLEISSNEHSIFEHIDAPNLESLRVTNFSIDNLNIHNYAELRQLSAIGGVQNISIKDCGNLRDLDISRNELQTVSTDRLDKLLALECEDTNMWHSSIDAPLLKRITDDGLIRYVLKRPEMI